MKKSMSTTIITTKMTMSMSTTIMTKMTMNTSTITMTMRTTNTAIIIITTMTTITIMKAVKPRNTALEFLHTTVVRYLIRALLTSPP